MISIIIPVYNTADYLNKCLSSIAMQTYKDFEAIVIDDGSTDDSPDICNEWALKDSRFKVIHQSNAGQSAARNAGIDVAQGEYLAFVDSDDYVFEEYLEKLLGALTGNKSDIAVCGYYECRSDKTEKCGPSEKCRLDRTNALEMLIDDKVLKSLFWGSLFKRELFDGIRLPVGRNYEDMAVIYRLYYKADTICLIPDPLYGYQIREGSMSFNDGTAQGWHDKCHSSVTSQIERTDFFRDNNEKKLADRSLALSVPYIYSDIMTGCQVGNDADVNECRDYLKRNAVQILRNPFLSVKDKILYWAYRSDNIAFKYLKKQR